MIKNVLENIGGIGAYGVIAILLFFTVFVGAILRALLLKRPDAETMSTIPLDDGSRDRPAEGPHHLKTYE